MIKFKIPYRSKIKSRQVFLFSSQILKTFLLTGLCFTLLFPFFYMFSMALRSAIDHTNPAVIFIPDNFTLNNFIRAYESLNFNTLFFNTLFLSGVTAFIQVIATATSGYAFSKLKFKGSNIIFYIVLFTITIPKETLHVSRVLMFVNVPFLGINLIGNIYSIFIMSAFGMGLRSAFFIYIFRQYFRSISKELEEAAQIDGASIIQIFYRIILPSAKAATLTIFILAFVWQWNDFYFPNFYNMVSKNFPVISTQFISRRWGSIDAPVLLMMFPLLVGYLLFQRVFVDGFEKIIVGE